MKIGRGHAPKGKPDSEAQVLLFSEEALLPRSLPRIGQLRPAHNLSRVFEDCHNYIYANEGLLKDRIFREMLKLVVMKLHDEQLGPSATARFGITSHEYRSVLGGTATMFATRIHGLLEEVRRSYPGLLTDTTVGLQPLTLARVVSRLQDISFSTTPADVKGEAFQAFIYRHQRGDRGEFFTPHPVVRLAVSIIAPDPTEDIIDPACGSGGFLLGAISHVKRNHAELDGPAYVARHIRGIDFNPDVALAALIRLAFEGASGSAVVCENALALKQPLTAAFDIVLTNPPFGSKCKIEDHAILKSYVLARKWNRVAGGWEPSQTVLPGQSPEVLFIERALHLLRPGGRMAIVLPDGLLHNVSAAHIRFWLRSQARVLAVVSIPQEAFVPYGTGIKTSVLVLQKFPAATRDECFMARIERIGYDVKGQPVYKRDRRGRPIAAPGGGYVVDEDVEEIGSAYNDFLHGNLRAANSRVYPIPDSWIDSRLDPDHYRPEDRRLVEQLEGSGAKPLGEVAHILTEGDDFRLAADGDIRYVAISDVDSRTMLVVSQHTMKSHEAPSRATYRIRRGDIITAVSGASTGTDRQATALVTADEDGAICSNGFAVLRDIHGVHPLFLLGYMRTELYLRQVRRLMTGHAIPSLSTGDLSKVLVPIPPKQEQERIATLVAAVQSARRAALAAAEKAVAETNLALARVGLSPLGGQPGAPGTPDDANTGSCRHLKQRVERILGADQHT
ncbi:MAG: N-6 DNA methylase [bacterium]|nr:N-6 DNA methylase [bacterium]